MLAVKAVTAAPAMMAGRIAADRGEEARHLKPAASVGSWKEGGRVRAEGAATPCRQCGVEGGAVRAAAVVVADADDTPRADCHMLFM